MKTILSAALAALLPFFLFAQSRDSITSVEQDAIFRNNLAKNDFDEALNVAKATLLKIDSNSQYYTALWKSRVGIAFLYKQENDSAIVYLNRAKAFFTKIEMRHESVFLAKICQNLGIAYTNKANYKKAEAELSEAVGILNNNETEPGKQALVSLYTVLTHFLSQTGEHEKLVQVTNEAITFTKKSFGDTIVLIGNLYQNLGVSYYRKGMYPEADREFEAALRQYELNETNRENSQKQRADALNNLGGMRFERGDYEGAVDYCAQAIHLLESQNFPLDAPEYLNAYGNIAQAFLKLGELQKAEKYFLKTRDVLRQKPDVLADVFATTYDGLGQTYLSMKMPPDTALSIHLEGLPLVRERFGVNWRTAFMQYNIGKDYLALKQQDSAIFFMNTAIKTYLDSPGGNPPLLSDIYRTLAELDTEQGRWSDALRLLDLSAAALSSVGNAGQAGFESRLWKAVFFAKADLFLKKYLRDGRQFIDLQNAHTNLQSSSRWLDRYRDSLIAYNPEILQNILGHTRLAEAILWEMYQAQPSQSLADEMFETADRGKSRELFEQFRFVNLLGNPAFADSIEREKELSKQMAIRWGRLAEFSGDKAFAYRDLRVQYQAELAHLKRQHDALLAWFDKKDPDFAKKRREPPRISRAETQALLDPGQCLLEYVLTDTAIYIFLLRKDRTLPPVVVRKDLRFRAWLDAVLNECRNPLKPSVGDDEIERRASQFGEAAHGLYRLLLEPLRPYLTSRVTVVRDAELNYLPFEVLLDAKPQAGAFFDSLPYLIRKFTFSYSNAAALYREARERKIKPLHHAIVVAPFANWSYGLWKKLSRSGEQPRSLRSSGTCDTLLNELATKEAFVRTVPKYRFVQLFTHAEADSVVGRKSFILLRKANDSIPEKMYAAEIFSLRLEAEIVALGACETAHGKLDRGEGMICLAWAFTGAGVRSLVATLWKAESGDAAPYILDRFYGLSNTMTRDAALRQAKLDYLKKQESMGDELHNAHPFFWAPFILIGENRQVKF